MPPRRNIFYSKNCDDAAEFLGGYERIDDSLDAVWDVLCNNPYKLPQCQSDWFNARYVVTLPTGEAPALVWLIVIQSNGDVVIDHVEEHEGY
jgi:hypothetical protein